MTLFLGSEHARAFAPKFIEVASLNAKVSDAILEQIERVRTAAALAPSSSLLVLGPAGTGKTHLFERMRRKVGAGATFVHIRPEIGVEASLEHVLLTVVDALKQPVANQSYAQLDVVVGSALALVNGDSPRFPSAFLEKVRGMSPNERDDLIQRALDRFEREDARLDTSWLELFLSVPFADSARKRAALAWLSGRDPSEVELRRLGLTEGLVSGRAVTGAAALGRFIAVGDYQGYVHLLARDDGAFAARLATDGSPITLPPLKLSDGVLVQTRDGGLYRIEVR